MVTLCVPLCVGWQLQGYSSWHDQRALAFVKILRQSQRMHYAVV